MTAEGAAELQQAEQNAEQAEVNEEVAERNFEQEKQLEAYEAGKRAAMVQMRGGGPVAGIRGQGINPAVARSGLDPLAGGLQQAGMIGAQVPMPVGSGINVGAERRANTVQRVENAELNAALRQPNIVGGPSLGFRDPALGGAFIENPQRDMPLYTGFRQPPAAGAGPGILGRGGPL